MVGLGVLRSATSKTSRIVDETAAINQFICLHMVTNL